MRELPRSSTGTTPPSPRSFRAGLCSRGDREMEPILPGRINAPFTPCGMQMKGVASRALERPCSTASDKISHDASGLRCSEHLRPSAVAALGIAEPRMTEATAIRKQNSRDQASSPPVQLSAQARPVCALCRSFVALIFIKLYCASPWFKPPL